ncbi:transcriptional regulator, TrmB [Thermogladius calderae 1633]|uniref:Transcriptional regulator, TrmB n=2 Tax=Thermogladius calderae TaxID=1200300 RepID=I3TEZ8_THEC1|nr:transcriptional regulator, TrmB [Thermogladius calderae 1633]
MNRKIAIRPTLMKTLKTVLDLKKVTADTVSQKTNRPRTIESKYLSELNRMGIVAKVREGRKVVYIEAVTAVKEAIARYGPDVNVEQLAHQISMPADIVRFIVEKVKTGKL